jgi:thioredoxin-related protein
MKKIILLIFMFCFIGSAFAQTEVKKDTVKTKIFDTSRDPKKDLTDAVKIAKKENKKILLDVGGDWCPWCRKLNKLFHENDEISSLLEKNYVVVKVNYSKENKNEKFLSKYPKIEGYPHLFVLDKKGKLIQSQNTGDLESGDHHDPAKVIEFLNKWK